MWNWLLYHLSTVNGKHNAEPARSSLWPYHIFRQKLGQGRTVGLRRFIFSMASCTFPDWTAHRSGFRSHSSRVTTFLEDSDAAAASCDANGVVLVRSTRSRSCAPAGRPIERNALTRSLCLFRAHQLACMVRRSSRSVSLTCVRVDRVFFFNSTRRRRSRERSKFTTWVLGALHFFSSLI
jgi:hypothetical protein